MNLTDISEDSGDEENAITAINAVTDAFEGAAIDIDAGKIVWSNGESLTIFQSVQKISQNSGVNGNSVLEHIGHWITMTFLLSGADPEQMKVFCENSGMESNCDE